MVIGNNKLIKCESCGINSNLNFDISMAFQPIIDADNKLIFSQEALVRGCQKESAGWVLSQVNAENKFAFDQTCRLKAINLSSNLKLDSSLNINFLPNAIHDPTHCIKKTLDAAHERGIPYENIIFEVTENERVKNPKHLSNIFNCYKEIGFKIAIDDFGAGYAGLEFFADFQPHFIKLDRILVQNIDKDPKRQVIVKGFKGICEELGIEIIAEGVEKIEEYELLKELKINLFQGYLFKKPQFEGICSASSINWP